MRRVYKYALPVQDDIELLMPEGAEILAVQAQADAPFVWALVDPDAGEAELRRFRLAGTGHDIADDEMLVHRGTFQLADGAFVGHLFERIEVT